VAVRKTEEEARAQVIALGCKPGPNFKYIGANEKMQLECPYGVLYNMKMGHIVAGRNCHCKKCSKPHVLKTTEEARAQVVALGHTPGPDFEYKNSWTKMQLVCPNNSGFYYMLMSNIIKGKSCGCRDCHPQLHAKTEEEARAQVVALGHTPGPDFEYKNKKTKMQLVCPNNSGFYYLMMSAVVAGRGCKCRKCCPARYHKTTEEARAQVIALGHTPGPDFNYESANKKVQLVCPNNSGFYYILIGDIIGGHSCDCNKCSGLKREYQCRNWFENRFQKLFPKTKPEWLLNATGHKLELDGYCEELKIAFEHNGEQHYKPYQFSNSQTKEEMMKKFMNQQQRDIVKLKLCQQFGVRLIVIPYYEKNVETFLEKQFVNNKD
jgi:hypothetical protein